MATGSVKGIGNVDPYRNFKYTVMIDGITSAGFAKVSGIISEIEAIMYREGGDNTHEKPYPGQGKYEPITLERGMTQDTELYQWFKSIQGDSAISTGTFNPTRRSLTIQILNRAGTKILMSIGVKNAWASRCEVGDLDAKANEILLNRVVIQHEGWEINLPNLPSSVDQ